MSLKLKTQKTTPYLAREIWVLRAMYDKFLLQGQKNLEGLQKEQNMILGKAVQDRLLALIEMKQVVDYYPQLSAILQEVRSGYESIYGGQKPQVEYSQLSQEYLEK